MAARKFHFRLCIITDKKIKIRSDTIRSKIDYNQVNIELSCAPFRMCHVSSSLNNELHMRNKLTVESLRHHIGRGQCQKRRDNLHFSLCDLFFSISCSTFLTLCRQKPENLGLSRFLFFQLITRVRVCAAVGVYWLEERRRGWCWPDLSWCGPCSIEWYGNCCQVTHLTSLAF